MARYYCNVNVSVKAGDHYTGLFLFSKIVPTRTQIANWKAGARELRHVLAEAGRSNQHGWQHQPYRTEVKRRKCYVAIATSDSNSNGYSAVKMYYQVKLRLLLFTTFQGPLFYFFYYQTDTVLLLLITPHLAACHGTFNVLSKY